MFNLKAYATSTLTLNIHLAVIALTFVAYVMNYTEFLLGIEKENFIQIISLVLCDLALISIIASFWIFAINPIEEIQ